MKTLTLTAAEVKALKTVVDYSIDDERENYEDDGRPTKHHIYIPLRKLDRALKRGAK